MTQDFTLAVALQLGLGLGGCTLGWVGAAAAVALVGKCAAAGWALRLGCFGWACAPFLLLLQATQPAGCPRPHHCPTCPPPRRHRH